MQGIGTLYSREVAYKSELFQLFGKICEQPILGENAKTDALERGEDVDLII